MDTLAVETLHRPRNRSGLDIVQTFTFKPDMGSDGGDEE